MSATVLRPTSLAEASDALADATARGHRICIGEDLDTSGLDRLLEHEPGDLTCTVEAGMRLATLQAALVPHGQRLSLDPPGDPTLGACVAAALSGPLRHRFGTPRDLVLGVTLVLADGTVVNAGGKVVKNVAGYDLGKLVCGSRGRLALIARVSLRLHPLPAAATTIVAETDDPAAAARAVLASQLQPSAVDVLHPGRVAVLFEGGARGVAAQVASARALVGGEESSDAVWAESRDRQARAEGVVRFPPRDLRSVLSTLTEAVARPAAGVAYVPHPVGGVAPAAVRHLQRALKQRFDPTETLV